MGLSLVWIPAGLAALFGVLARVIARKAAAHSASEVHISTYGGPALLAALFCASFIHPMSLPDGLAAGAIGMFVIGAIDDRRPFSPRYKLMWTAVVAATAVGLGIRLDIVGWVWADSLMTVVWVVFLCHAFNVFDMADGLSAGGAILASAGMWWVGGGDWHLVVSGALLGFLVHNVYPARLYMGDAGSLTVGFLLGAGAVSVAHGHGSSGVVGALIILGLPIFEAGIISVLRFAKGRPISAASRDHVAQRLISWGASVPGAVGLMWGAGTLLAGLGILVVSNALAWQAGLAMAILAALIAGRGLSRVDMEGDGADGRPAGLFSKNWLIHRLMQQAMREASAYAAGTLLDAGCGTRPYAQIFAPRIRREIGLEQDRGRYGAAHVWGDVGALPFGEGAFDTVLSNQVLEHVAEPQQVLREVARVLRPDGHLILTAPHIWEVHEVPHDYYRFTPYGLRYLAEKAGLEVVEIRAMAGFWVTAGARFCYYLARFDRSVGAPVVRVAFLVVQLGALFLDRLHRVEGDAWNFLMIAKKPQ
jgi:UDP-N-acetylmuramyl pentapeptide phosphotransferase/UDP-N-acetylglucosamine-1-phosphate transferase/SAM-dependent methyltransferase